MSWICCLQVRMENQVYKDFKIIQLVDSRFRIWSQKSLIQNLLLILQLNLRPCLLGLTVQGSEVGHLTAISHKVRSGSWEGDRCQDPQWQMGEHRERSGLGLVTCCWGDSQGQNPESWLHLLTLEFPSQLLGCLGQPGPPSRSSGGGDRGMSLEAGTWATHPLGPWADFPHAFHNLPPPSMLNSLLEVGGQALGSAVS